MLKPILPRQSKNEIKQRYGNRGRESGRRHRYIPSIYKKLKENNKKNNHTAYNAIKQPVCWVMTLVK